MKHSESPDPGTPAWHIRTLTESARQLAKNGNMADAENIYEQILDAAPYHIRSLNFLATRATERGDISRARALYDRALEVDPKRPIIHQNIGMLLLEADDYDGALGYFQTATNIREDFIYSWIHQGIIHDRSGRKQDAISAYAHAIKFLPSVNTTLTDSSIPAPKRELIRKAAAALYSLKYEYFMQALSDCLLEYGEGELKRVVDAARIKSGLAVPEYRHALQHPDWLYMPDVTPEAFFDTGKFDWVQGLENQYKSIRDELRVLLSEPKAFDAYVDIASKEALQWNELNHSTAWSSFHLYRSGEPLADNCQRCPITSKILSELPLLKIKGHAAEAFFSVLQPGTHIPPHHGLANYKLAVHLPLIIPEECAIRVGYETRTWTEGKCLIFDDSFQHEAWNKSDKVRAVFIFEIWNPALTTAERAGITALAIAANEFQAKYAA